jgi:hypothetical protein
MVILLFLFFGSGVTAAGLYAGRNDDKVAVHSRDVRMPEGSVAIKTTWRERRAARAMAGGGQP